MSIVSTSDTGLLDQIDWGDIIDTLQAQKCILFMGSGAFQAPGQRNLEEAKSEWLGLPDPKHPHIRLQNEDGFLLLRKNRYKRKVIASLREFYSQSFPETASVFSQLARIPFNIIVSLTPDNLLARTFDNLGLDYQLDFYFHHRKAPEKFEAPTAQRPLIYNLLGNIEEPESLILTHQDFFDYLDSIFKGNSMHEDLLLTLENAERYIFLGLPYEKWYFQLLLRVLSLHSDKLKEVERLALQEFENPRLRDEYKEEFKIEFIPTEIDAFLQRLYEECEKNNILKEIPTTVRGANENLSPDTLRELIAEGKMQRAMEQLKLNLQAGQPRTTAALNQLTVLRNRHRLLQQRDQRGTIDSRDLSVENNQIVEQLLELITLSTDL
jgi:hypothetical protein